MNRFAALNLSSDEDSDEDNAQTENQTSEEPVAYNIKEINWKIGEAIHNLRAFKLRNANKRRNGPLFLEFVNEKEAEKAFRHLRSTFKLKFSPLNVPLTRDRICFHCRREDHWGNECLEGPYSILPSELYGRIVAFMAWTDTFSFLYTSKRLLKGLAPQINAVSIARPRWLMTKKISLKLTVLRSLKNLNKLVLKGILSSSFPPPHMIMSLSRLTSLSIVNSRRPKWDDLVIDQAMVASICKLTKLTKLDLDGQTMSPASISSLTTLSNLTQLRIRTQTAGEDLDALDRFKNLKKLAVSYGTNHMVPLPDTTITRLSSLIINCQGTVTLPATLPALKKLYLSSHDVLGLKSAPNLTKLKWYNFNHAISIEDCFDNLVSLTLSINYECDSWKVNMPSLKKLVLHCNKPLAVDLQGAISLEKLVYNDANQAKLQNVPSSLQELIVLPQYYMELLCDKEDWAKLRIRSFQLIGEDHAYTAKPPDTAQFFSHLQQVSTLRYLKLDSMPEEYLSHLTGLTQLAELDLVNNPIVLADKKPVSQEKILELSKLLPTTRIKYGFDPPTTTKRDLNHWLVSTMNNRDYVPFWQCTCSYCRNYE